MRTDHRCSLHSPGRGQGGKVYPFPEGTWYQRYPTHPNPPPLWTQWYTPVKMIGKTSSFCIRQNVVHAIKFWHMNIASSEFDKTSIISKKSLQAVLPLLQETDRPECDTLYMEVHYFRLFYQH